MSDQRVNAQRPSVVPIDLSTESSLIEPSPGVEVRHVVTERLMVRDVLLAEDAVLEVHEAEAEHVVVALEGEVATIVEGREEPVRPGALVVVRTAEALRIASRNGSARVQLLTSPPDPALVRYLFHLEHEGHGFD